MNEVGKASLYIGLALVHTSAATVGSITGATWWVMVVIYAAMFVFVRLAIESLVRLLKEHTDA